MSRDGNSVADNLSSLKVRVDECAQRANRNPGSIRVIAITKFQPLDKLEQAIKWGQRDFGENYLQEAEDKINSLQSYNDISWHFVGRIQRKKIKSIVGAFSWLHSVDRLKVLEEMQKQEKESNIPNILIQVNLSGEESKGGVSLSHLPQFLEKAQNLSGFKIQGLMTMPPLSESPEDSRGFFSKLCATAEEHSRFISAPHGLRELSMGTTNDFEVAIEEGATMIRIGRSIFGERKG